jgi:hypothetical protein
MAMRALIAQDQLGQTELESVHDAPARSDLGVVAEGSNTLTEHDTENLYATRTAQTHQEATHDNDTL